MEDQYRFELVVDGCVKTNNVLKVFSDKTHEQYNLLLKKDCKQRFIEAKVYFK